MTSIGVVKKDVGPAGAPHGMGGDGLLPIRVCSFPAADGSAPPAAEQQGHGT